MKKLLIIALLFVSATSFSQDKYQVVGLESGMWNGKTWVWDKLITPDLTITLSGAHIYISDQADTHITTYENLGEDKGVDKQGDSYTSYTWRAYDEKDRRCKFIMQFYQKGDYNIYYIMYNDMCFRYYVDKKKNSGNFFQQPQLP